ncbi:hypothetical protein KIN20_026929 [Parelaphostrongylus tenuis]|uniref:Uncharacterized protein n=1 Tax=Parelaphostrongylus tenuis TaxID=148309 RepID=A0AAD5QYM9_PARTN|nr:hypothetical protein KIN20_026929 [Parelaphostrongylus tenuis]
METWPAFDFAIVDNARAFNLLMNSNSHRFTEPTELGDRAGTMKEAINKALKKAIPSKQRLPLDSLCLPITKNECKAPEISYLA